MAFSSCQLLGVCCILACSCANSVLPGVDEESDCAGACLVESASPFEVMLVQLGSKVLSMPESHQPLAVPPKSSSENLKWHHQFETLSSNLETKCHSLKWTTESDCTKAHTVLEAMLAIPTDNSTDTLMVAGIMSQLHMFHLPDESLFGRTDPDKDGVMTKSAFTQVFGNFLNESIGAAAMNVVFKMLDGDADNNVTRTEYCRMGRASRVISHFIPDIDEYNVIQPLTDTQVLDVCKLIEAGPLKPKPFESHASAFFTALVIIVGILVFAIAFYYAYKYWTGDGEDSQEEKEDTKKDKKKRAGSTSKQ